MGGATSVMPVIRDAFSQQAADTTHCTDRPTIDWMVRCDWLQVASFRIILYTYNNYANDGCKTCTSLSGLLASFIVVVIAILAK